MIVLRHVAKIVILCCTPHWKGSKDVLIDNDSGYQTET